MGTAAKVLLIAMLVVAGQVTAQPATNALDEATCKEAEAMLARGVAWLQTQQGADGRIGTNEHAAVTAAAVALGLSMCRSELQMTSGTVNENACRILRQNMEHDEQNRGRI